MAPHIRAAGGTSARNCPAPAPDPRPARARKCPWSTAPAARADRPAADSNCRLSITSERAARSTVWPRRASRYSGCPSRLSAEYIGGVCCCAPWNRASTASTAAWRQRRHRAALDNLAFRIAGLRALAQLDAELVALAQRQHLTGKSRGLAQTDRQHAARQRIEAAGVSGLDAAGKPPHPLQRCVGGQSQRLVEQQHAGPARRSSVLVGSADQPARRLRPHRALAIGLHRAIDQLRQVLRAPRSRYRDETRAAARAAVSVRAPFRRAGSRRRCAGRSAPARPGARRQTAAREYAR